MNDKLFATPKAAIKIERPHMVEFSEKEADPALDDESAKKIESESYAKGFGEGIELGISQGVIKAAREIDVSVQEVLLRISRDLQAIVDRENEFHNDFFKNAVVICKAVLAKTMPIFYAMKGAEEMEAILKDVIESMIVSVPIKIKVSERLREYLSERLSGLRSAYPETIEIVSDANISDSGCEMEWAGGGAKWSLDERHRHIAEKLDFYLKTNFTEGENHG